MQKSYHATTTGILQSMTNHSKLLQLRLDRGVPGTLVDLWSSSPASQPLLCHLAFLNHILEAVVIRWVNIAAHLFIMMWKWIIVPNIKYIARYCKKAPASGIILHSEQYTSCNYTLALFIFDYLSRNMKNSTIDKKIWLTNWHVLIISTAIGFGTWSMQWRCS